jgi:hypothetical protein
MPEWQGELDALGFVFLEDFKIHHFAERFVFPEVRWRLRPWHAPAVAAMCPGGTNDLASRGFSGSWAFWRSSRLSTREIETDQRGIGASDDGRQSKHQMGKSRQFGIQTRNRRTRSLEIVVGSSAIEYGLSSARLCGRRADRVAGDYRLANEVAAVLGAANHCYWCSLLILCFTHLLFVMQVSLV